jgi:hypothetical protein
MAQTPTQTNWKYLWRKPGSVYLQLFVNGRVAARTLYGRYMSAEDPQTIEEIAADWNLPIEAVKEAIAYCQSDPPEIRLDFQREEALIEASGMNDPDYWKDPKGKYRIISPEERAKIIDRFKPQ